MITEEDIIFEDNHILVVNKPVCVPVQLDSSEDESLFEMCKEYIKVKYKKEGNVYLGMVHRLDRPVSGIILFAKTSKAAKRLSEELRNKDFKKTYYAIVQGRLKNSGKLKDYIYRKSATSHITSNPKKGKEAKLSYKVLWYEDNKTYLKINLETGRHHQIRVQFANQNHPLIGDFRYGSKIKFPNKSIALHAGELSFMHPTKKEMLTFKSNPSFYEAYPNLK